MPAHPRPVLLTGSLPLGPASKMFETVAARLGTLVPRIPDGEQVGWIQVAWRSLPDNPALEESDPVKLSGRAPAGVATYRLRPGALADDLVLGPYGYAANALASYAEFKRLRDAGIIPAGTRYQVTLPGPGTSAYVVRIPAEELLPKARTALWTEIAQIARSIPARDLTIQLDIAMEAEHEEWRRRPQAFDTPVHEIFDWTLDQMADSVAWLANRIPADVELGFHICSIWHHYPDSGQDNVVLVDIANALSSRIERPIGYIHIPIIPEHDTAADYAPFGNLDLNPGTRLYLGLVNLLDGLEGGRRRVALAETVVSDFGIGFWCGLGGGPLRRGQGEFMAPLDNPGRQRATQDTLVEVLDLHRAIAEV